MSGISKSGAGSFISRIASDTNPVLVFMPNLNYDGMDDADKLADELKISLLHIPITLPTMDIIKQLEYAGVDMDGNTLKDLESGLRTLIIDTLEKRNGGK